MIIKGISIPIVDCSEKYPVHTYLFRIVPSFLSVVSPPPFFLQASIGSPTHIHRPSLGKGQKMDWKNNVPIRTPHVGSQPPPYSPARFPAGPRNWSAKCCGDGDSRSPGSELGTSSPLLIPLPSSLKIYFGNKCTIYLLEVAMSALRGELVGQPGDRETRRLYTGSPSAHIPMEHIDISPPHIRPICLPLSPLIAVPLIAMAILVSSRVSEPVQFYFSAYLSIYICIYMILLFLQFHLFPLIYSLLVSVSSNWEPSAIVRLCKQDTLLSLQLPFYLRIHQRQFRESSSQNLPSTQSRWSSHLHHGFLQ